MAPCCRFTVYRKTGTLPRRDINANVSVVAAQVVLSYKNPDNAGPAAVPMP